MRKNKVMTPEEDRDHEEKRTVAESERLIAPDDDGRERCWDAWVDLGGES